MHRDGWFMVASIIGRSIYNKLGFKYLTPSQQAPEGETILWHSKELRPDICVRQVVKLELPVISALTKRFQTPPLPLGNKRFIPPLTSHKINTKKQERISVQKYLGQWLGWPLPFHIDWVKFQPTFPISTNVCPHTQMLTYHTGKWAEREREWTQRLLT